jgi:hypothetical protein
MRWRLRVSSVELWYDTRPRRIIPGVGRSGRTAAASDDRSCHGTLVTITRE